MYNIRMLCEVFMNQTRSLLCSVAEPEPVEPKLFCGTGVETGAVISYFGSGSTALEPKLPV